MRLAATESYSVKRPSLDALRRKSGILDSTRDRSVSGRIRPSSTAGLKPSAIARPSRVGQMVFVPSRVATCRARQPLPGRCPDGLVQVREEEPGVIRIMAEAKNRIRVDEIRRSKDGFLQAQFTEIEDPMGSADSLLAIVDTAVKSFDRLRIRRGLPEEARLLLEVAFTRDDPKSLPSAALHYLATGAESHWISVGSRQALLEANSWSERIQKMTDLFDAEPRSSQSRADDSRWLHIDGAAQSQGGGLTGLQGRPPCLASLGAGRFAADTTALVRQTRTIAVD